MSSYPSLAMTPGNSQSNIDLSTIIANDGMDNFIILNCPECKDPKNIIDNPVTIKINDEGKKSIILFCSNKHKLEIAESNIVEETRKLTKCKKCSEDANYHLLSKTQDKVNEIICSKCLKEMSSDEQNDYIYLKKDDLRMCQGPKEKKQNEHTETKEYSKYCKQCKKHYCNECNDSHEGHLSKFLDLHSMRPKQQDVYDFEEQLKGDEEVLKKEEEKLKETLEKIQKDFDDYKNASLSLIKFKRLVIESLKNVKENYNFIQNAKEILNHKDFKFKFDLIQHIDEIKNKLGKDIYQEKIEEENKERVENLNK